MENEFEYYILLSENLPNKPGVVLTGKPKRTEIFVQHPVDIKLVELRFDGEYKDPLMADLLYDGVHDVVSEKISGALSPLTIQGIQLIPAKITAQQKQVYEGYYYLHIYNRIKCMDKKQSDYMGDDEMDLVLAINKLVIDTAALAKIPLEQRLVFRLKEVHTFQLFHKSVVDAIMSTEPVGLRFVKISDWGPGTAFD